MKNKRLLQLLAVSLVGLSVNTAMAKKMETAQSVAPPLEFVKFCVMNSGACAKAPKHASSLKKLTSKAWKDLTDVQHLVNTSVQPVDDYKVHGVADKWTFPIRNMGDCEDITLKKRALLIERGWSSKSLLVTTAITEKGEYHVVLTARTDKGDYILDNRFGQVMAWQEINYKWLARQTAKSPLRWVKLTGREKQELASITYYNNVHAKF